MKKLILALCIGFITFATGQAVATVSQPGVPVSVVGDMYVKGPVRFKGEVHVKTATDTTKRKMGGVIDNQEGGHLQFNKVILYSDTLTDGLLRNSPMSSIPLSFGTVEADTLVVRKFFGTTSVIVGVQPTSTRHFYTFSLPFRVGLLSEFYTNSDGNYYKRTNNWKSRIVKPDSSEAKLWVDYDVAFYDGHKRATVTRRPDTHENYTQINEDSTIYGSTAAAFLTAGEGHRFWSAVDYLDFQLFDSDSIAVLFDYSENKGKERVKPLYYERVHNIYENYHLNEGWNLIGGLYTTSFLFKGGVGVDHVVTVDGTNGVFYYQDVEDPLKNSEDSWVWESDIFDDAQTVLSPYTTFYVQTSGENAFLKYSHSGLVTAASNPIGFRAAEVPTKDLLRLTIASKTNPSRSRKAYIALGANYTKQFNSGEDGVQLFNDNSLSPQIYSWFRGESTSTQEGGTVYELFLNSLPLGKETEEVQLGIVSPASEQYMFSLNAVQRLSVKSAFLYDKQESQYVDLLQDTYTCRIDKGKIDDRFVLFVNQTGTLVDEVYMNGDAVFAYVKNNVLTVKNLQKGDQIKILDMSGRTVASGIAPGNEYSANLTQKGVYLVHLKGEKVRVLKVLNK
jgi:hypothetical protein